jgi:hypothetical protein
MLSKRKFCYCAFCKVERKVYASRHLSLVEIIGLVFLGIISTYTVFRSLDPRGLFFVALLMLLGEAFAQSKWRVSMICTNCGFDPVVYVRSPEQAGLKIKAFLDKRADSPQHLLRPPVVLPLKKQSKGQNLSLKM